MGDIAGQEAFVLNEVTHWVEYTGFLGSSTLYQVSRAPKNFYVFVVIGSVPHLQLRINVLIACAATPVQGRH